MMIKVVKNGLRYLLLFTVKERGKLCCLSCYLDKNWGSFWWVPEELHSVKLSRVSPGINYANGHGDICNRSTLNRLLSKKVLYAHDLLHNITTVIYTLNFQLRVTVNILNWIYPKPPQQLIYIQGRIATFFSFPHTINTHIKTRAKRFTRHLSSSAHLSRGCDLRACSSASLPAAGAPCTEVFGHETPHGWCSEVRRFILEKIQAEMFVLLRMKLCVSQQTYLHHFTSDFRKFTNFPIVKHSNFIGLTCNHNNKCTMK